MAAFRAFNLIKVRNRNDDQSLCWRRKSTAQVVVYRLACFPWPPCRHWNAATLFAFAVFSLHSFIFTSSSTFPCSLVLFFLPWACRQPHRTVTWVWKATQAHYLQKFTNTTLALLLSGLPQSPTFAPNLPPFSSDIFRCCPDLYSCFKKLPDRTQHCFSSPPLFSHLPPHLLLTSSVNDRCLARSHFIFDYVPAIINGLS